MLGRDTAAVGGLGALGPCPLAGRCRAPALPDLLPYPARWAGSVAGAARDVTLGRLGAAEFLCTGGAHASLAGGALMAKLTAIGRAGIDVVSELDMGPLSQGVPVSGRGSGSPGG